MKPLKLDIEHFPFVHPCECHGITHLQDCTEMWEYQIGVDGYDMYYVCEHEGRRHLVKNEKPLSWHEFHNHKSLEKYRAKMVGKLAQLVNSENQHATN